MITVNTISISNNALNLNVDISTGNTYRITSAKLWTEESFKDYSLAKNLNFKLSQTTNTEAFILSAEEIGLVSFSGIYFLEFTSNQPPVDECDTCPNPLLVVVTNLNQYYRCMAELILKADICVPNLFSKEVCDDNAVNKALTANLLLEAIKQCLELGQFTEAVILMKDLKKLCAKCTNCKTITKLTSCSSCNSYY